MTGKKEYNRSINYVLPLVFESNERIGRVWNTAKYPEQLFVDTFLSYDLYPDYKEHIFILYIKEPIDNPIYNIFEHSTFKTRSNFEFKDVKGNYNIYCLKIYDKFIQDYKLILEGKYSKIKDETKLHILKFLGQEYKNNDAKTSDMFDVLYKTDNRRLWLENLIGCRLDKDSELASILDTEKENLTLDKLYVGKLAGYNEA